MTVAAVAVVASASPDDRDFDSVVSRFGAGGQGFESDDPDSPTDDLGSDSGWPGFDPDGQDCEPGDLGSDPVALLFSGSVGQDCDYGPGSGPSGLDSGSSDPGSEIPGVPDSVVQDSGPDDPDSERVPSSPPGSDDPDPAFAET